MLEHVTAFVDVDPRGAKVPAHQHGLTNILHSGRDRAHLWSQEPKAIAAWIVITSAAEQSIVCVLADPALTELDWPLSACAAVDTSTAFLKHVNGILSNQCQSQTDEPRENAPNTSKMLTQ